MRMVSLGGAVAVACGLLAAQPAPGHDAWLMKNYHFTGPPPAGRPTDPVVSDLREIQNALMSMLRTARYEGDYETAFYLAQQAAANAQTLGTIEQGLAAQAKPGPQQAAAPEAAPVFTIAFKDRTTESALRYWSDGAMLHYITTHGAHVQVRMDLVDVALSERINQGRFHVP
jgi:hypothetical protein